MKQPAANPADVQSIDKIVRAAYDGISGPAGPRNWGRERSLFWPGARLIPTAREAGSVEVGLAPNMLDVEGFIARAAAHLSAHSFYETEIARRVEQFGRIAQVWSTYESRHDPSDPQPFMRGINSFQLFHDGARWWIVSLYWQHEMAEWPIPEKYLASA